MTLIVDFDTLESGYRGCKKWPWFFWSNSKNHFLWRQKPLEFIARLLSLGNHDLSPLTKCPQTWKKRDTFRVTLISAINHQFQFFPTNPTFYITVQKLLRPFEFFRTAACRKSPTVVFFLCHVIPITNIEPWLKKSLLTVALAFIKIGNRYLSTCDTNDLG